MKILLCTLGILMFIQCKSDKSSPQSAQSNVEEYFKIHGPMWKGYQFISMTPLDTVTAKDFLDRQLESLSLVLMNKDIKLKRLDSLESSFKSGLAKNPADETLSTNLNAVIRSKTELYVYQHKMDSLNQSLQADQFGKIKFIGTDFSFNAKDPSGATKRYTYYVKFDEHLNVESVTNLDTNDN